MRLLERLCDDYVATDGYQDTAAARELIEERGIRTKNIIEKIGRDAYLRIESDIARSEAASERYSFAMGVSYALRLCAELQNYEL